MAEYEFDFQSTTLSVTLEADSAVTGATLALPYIFRGGAVSSATVDGESVEVCPQQLEGPGAGAIVGRLLGRRGAQVADQVGYLVGTPLACLPIDYLSIV